MGMTFRPTILVADPGRELRWLGHLLIGGVFDGEHRFAIEPLGEDHVRFTHEERFSGFLAGPLGKLIHGATVEGFSAMNRALKERAERAEGG